VDASGCNSWKLIDDRLRANVFEIEIENYYCTIRRLHKVFVSSLAVPKVRPFRKEGAVEPPSKISLTHITPPIHQPQSPNLSPEHLNPI
jgi:hypothetical protein